MFHTLPVRMNFASNEKKKDRLDEQVNEKLARLAYAYVRGASINLTY
jgi:hypothetical protein